MPRYRHWPEALGPDTDCSYSRQDTTDKAASALKPDSEKGVLEKAQDTVKSTADSVAGSVQPGMQQKNCHKLSYATY
jgi:hypothetical protein